LKFILHIGQSKTGTSAIQAFLSGNYRELIRQGFLYPRTLVNGTEMDLKSHNSFVDSISGKPAFPFLSTTEYLDSFFSQAAKHSVDTMILSAEHFFGGHPRTWEITNHDNFLNIYREKVRKIAQVFLKHETMIVGYFRPQIDWVASAISHTIRISRLISETSIYESDRQYYLQLRPSLKYAKLMQIWEKEFKSKDIIAVPYDRKFLHNNSSSKDFMFRVGIDDQKSMQTDFGGEVNNSLSHEFTEVKKILNIKKRSKANERATINCLSSLSSRLTPTSRYQISQFLADEITEFVEKDNKFFNENYVVSDTVLNEKSARPPIYEKTPFSNEEIGNYFQVFTKEFAKPNYRFQVLNNYLKAVLRENFKPLHSWLHGMKRFFENRD
jgi:hypothetical protein